MNSSSPIIWNKLAHQPTDLRQHVRLKLYTRFLVRKITDVQGFQFGIFGLAKNATD